MLAPNDPKHGTRKLMGLDAPVFVDGTQVGVLRYGEMPVIPGRTLEGGTQRYRVFDYLRAIGVRPASVRSIHFHGNGDRIASVEGAELLAQKDRFEFQFISNDTGTALQRWDGTGLKNEFVVHEIRRMTIYVQKASPAIHPSRQCHTDAEGKCTDEIPYATGELAKGTRVYVDGKMVGYVKRRQIGESLRMGETPSGEHLFSIVKLVSSFDVDPSGIAQVDLVAGDEVIARASGEQWTRTLASRLNFTLPQHRHGKIRASVPAEIRLEGSSVPDRDALVSSVLVYKRSQPSTRPLVAISEDTDLSVEVATIDPPHATQRQSER
jgi:hypothetical protein